MTKGERIKECIGLSDLSRTDIAKKAGMSKQLLYKYENDRVSNMRSDHLEQLANVLGVSPHYLMGWTDNMAGMTQPSEGLAVLTTELIKDRAMAKALFEYFTLTDEQKSNVINTIHLFASSTETGGTDEMMRLVKDLHKARAARAKKDKTQKKAEKSSDQSSIADIKPGSFNAILKNA